MLTDPDSATIMTEQNEERSLLDLPVALKLQDRQELEMLVLGQDPPGCSGVLGDTPQRGEQGKLQIRWDDKGPTMDLSE